MVSVSRRCAAVLLWLTLVASIGGHQAPPHTADLVVVKKAQRTLSLYRDGKPLKTYRIALGRNAIGHKERQGDSRTPEGNYLIDFRKADSRFHRVAAHLLSECGRSPPGTPARGLAWRGHHDSWTPERFGRRRRGASVT